MANEPHPSQMTSVPVGTQQDWEPPQLVYFPPGGKPRHTLPPYTHQEYPRMMYRLKPDGSVETNIVTSIESEQDAVNDDWVRHTSGTEQPEPPPVEVIKPVIPKKVTKTKK